MEQIIRCKNCEYFREWDDGSSPTCMYWTDIWDVSTWSDGFCSFGKLKEGCEAEIYEPVKHGHLITKNHNNSEIYFCSNCGDELLFDGDSIIDVNYCPRCGAKLKMVKKDDK